MACAHDERDRTRAAGAEAGSPAGRRAPRRRVKLLVVEDHAELRAELVALLDCAPGLRVVGEAASAAEAIARARRAAPDVVLLDVRLPDGSGIDACRQILAERPTTRVIMLTAYHDDQALMASILAGAHGYLLKHTEPAQLVEAVRRAAGGGSPLDPMMAPALLDWVRQHQDLPAEDLATLTAQERAILVHIAAGKTNRQIAPLVGLSPNTVKAYVSMILQKLHVRRRSEAAAYLARRLRQPPP